MTVTWKNFGRSLRALRYEVGGYSKAPAEIVIAEFSDGRCQVYTEIDLMGGVCDDCKVDNGEPVVVRYATLTADQIGAIVVTEGK